MNFKFMFLFLFFFIGCGVKGDPVAPVGTKTPSVLENYDEIKPDKALRDSYIRTR